MPDPGSKAYDDHKSRIRRDLERHGVGDELAAERSDRAMDEVNEPEGRKRVNARSSGAGNREGSAWPDRPPPAG